MSDVVKKGAKDTAPEREIKAQVADQGTRLASDDRQTGILKAEQPINEEIPDNAELVRGYWKWTDNDGNFHKVPIDGTNAIRQPSHEQHELTVEDRDRLYQALELKTPRRDNAKAKEILNENVRNDEVHDALQGEGVAPAAPEKGPVQDSDEAFVDEAEVKVGSPANV